MFLFHALRTAMVQVFPLGFALASAEAMSGKRRRVESTADWADRVVECVLSQDWVTRHETLDIYLKNKTLRELVPGRLSPCQSKYGTWTALKTSRTIPLPEYSPSPLQKELPLKQTKIANYFLKQNSKG